MKDIILQSSPFRGTIPIMVDPERSAHASRAAHEPTVHLTFSEASARLRITPNAVRMRVYRGTLASVRVNERTFVVWPQSTPLHSCANSVRATYVQTVKGVCASPLRPMH